MVTLSKVILLANNSSFDINGYEVNSINLDKRAFRDELRQVRVTGGAARYFFIAAHY